MLCGASLPSRPLPGEQQVPRLRSGSQPKKRAAATTKPTTTGVIPTDPALAGEWRDLLPCASRHYLRVR